MNRLNIRRRAIRRPLSPISRGTLFAWAVLGSQHECQQYGLRCERLGRQDNADRVDRREIRRHQPSGCDRRVLPLQPEFLLRHTRRRGALFRLRALTMRRYLERDLRRRRLEVCTEVGCLPRRHAHTIQWWVGERLFREQQRRYYGGDCASAIDQAWKRAAMSSTP